MATQPNQSNEPRTAPPLTSPFQMGSDGFVIVSDSMHEGGYEGDYNTFNQPTIRKAAQVAKQTRADITPMHNDRLNRIPLETDAKHRKRLKDELQNADPHIMRRIRGVIADFTRDISSLERELDENANLFVDKDYINPITAAFHGLTPADKQKHIGRMIEEKRGKELAILINSDELISGLNAEQRAATRRRVWEKVAPNKVRQLDELRAAFNRFDKGGEATGGKLHQMYDGLDFYTAEIERVKNLTKKTTAGFAE